MKPLRHLWPALESVPGLRAILAEWKFRFSSEFEVLRRFLVVTNEVATSYPVFEFGEPFSIVQHSIDDYSAIDPNGGQALALRQSDVLVHRFDFVQFARIVGKALKSDGDPQRLGAGDHLLRIGTLPIDLGGRPVFFVMPFDSMGLSAAADTIASISHQPYLLLVPTRDLVNANIESAIGRNDGQLVAIGEILQIDSRSQFQISSSATHSIRSMFGAGPSGNVFKCDGDAWTISFEGKSIHLTDTVGLKYIARLLREPNRAFPLLDLHEQVTGVNSLVAKGTSGELLTQETRAVYKSRYCELEAELQTAEANNDLGQGEKLQIEMHELQQEVSRSTGIGGRSRENSDFERIRKKISEAITRDINRIGKSHQGLSTHLSNCITKGVVCRYQPDSEKDWVT